MAEQTALNPSEINVFLSRQNSSMILTGTI
mgnify:CR=1 FL=1